MKKLPKIIFTDIDGVWTDGGMYYSESGEEFKKFNTSDSAGVLFANMLSIPVVIITGENSNAVLNRAQKLNINHCYIGVKNKIETASELLKELSIQFEDAAFIGDDINDYLLLEAVGQSACPKSAPEYIKKIVDFIVPVSGGKGAFRKFVEHLIFPHISFEEILQVYKQKR